MNKIIYLIAFLTISFASCNKEDNQPLLLKNVWFTPYENSLEDAFLRTRIRTDNIYEYYVNYNSTEIHEEFECIEMQHNLYERTRVNLYEEGNLIRDSSVIKERFKIIEPTIPFADFGIEYINLTSTIYYTGDSIVESTISLSHIDIDNFIYP